MKGKNRCYSRTDDQQQYYISTHTYLKLELLEHVNNKKKKIENEDHKKLCVFCEATDEERKGCVCVCVYI